jgi:hypothetical protein
VWNPHIQIIPWVAREFGGIINLTIAPAEYSRGLRNLDQRFISYMVYNYTAEQALNIVGIFRH